MGTSENGRQPSVELFVTDPEKLAVGPAGCEHRSARDFRVDERFRVGDGLRDVDGFGDGGRRTVEADTGEHVIGGGNDGNWGPKAMDTVSPGGIDRTAVLSDYDE